MCINQCVFVRAATDQESGSDQTVTNQTRDSLLLWVLSAQTGRGGRGGGGVIISIIII